MTLLSIPLILDAVLLISEIALVWRRPASRAPSTRKDGGSHLLLWIVIVGSIICGNFVGLRHAGPVHLLWPWIGAGIFAFGTGFRWWAINHLGRFFSVDVAIANDHRVVDTGPYRFVRHPSYTGLLMQCAGLAVALGTLSSILIIVLPTFLALFYRIHVEEKALLHSLGEDYTAYTRRTKRLIPGVL